MFIVLAVSVAEMTAAAAAAAAKITTTTVIKCAPLAASLLRVRVDCIDE